MPPNVIETLDPWHYQGWGSSNTRNDTIMELARQKLQSIPSPQWLQVNSTGYWRRVDDIPEDHKNKYTVDSVGRSVLILDNVVIMQRYLQGGLFISYPIVGEWSHTVMDIDAEDNIYNKLQNL